MTTVIVSFPASRVRPPSPETRLARALANLAAALADQRTAALAWNASLAALQTATSSLGVSLNGYGRDLDHLASGVQALHHEARQLEAIAS